MSTIAASMAPKLLELETSNLVCGFVWKCTAGAQIIFPESGRGLGDVTPTIFGIQSNLSSKLLELVYRLQIWYVALYGECRSSGRTNNFP